MATKLAAVILPLLLAGRTAGDLLSCLGGTSLLTHLQDSNSTYDYIIVGGGTSGLTVANRLTEDPDVTVLVVEYGSIDNNQSVLLPYTVNVNSFHDLFPLVSVPMTNVDNRTYFVAAAATVGGGSVVNGMFFDRAAASDYDGWEALGNPGWGWDGLFPYFIKSTNFSIPTPEVAEKYNYTWDASVWGSSGPIHSSLPPFQWPELPTFIRAWRDLDVGITYPQDGSGGSGVGVKWVPTSQDPTMETRSSARTGYYDPVANRSNLHLLVQTQVHKVNFEGQVAVGVSMTSLVDGKWATASARNEVIMAAGAVYSVNLLQKSGIGPRDMLEEAGIEVVHDLPGVGSNFQDHPTTYMYYEYTNDTYPYPALLQSNDTFYEEAENEYYANRTGPLIQAHGNNAASLSLRTISPDAESIIASIQAQNTSQYLPPSYDSTSRKGYAAQHAILTSQFNGTKNAVYETTFQGGQNGVSSLQRPLSRGTIKLNMSDPSLGPLVDFNTLANPIDEILVVVALNFTRRYFQTPTLATLGPVELSPGAKYASTSEILAVLKESLLSPSFSHPSCANPMMPLELGGVVSPELLVYGVEKLSIVDSSIMPIIPAAHLSGTVYAIAEKAADLIKARHQGNLLKSREDRRSLAGL